MSYPLWSPVILDLDIFFSDEGRALSKRSVKEEEEKAASNSADNLDFESAVIKLAQEAQERQHWTRA